MIKYPVFFADALQELQINQVDVLLLVGVDEIYLVLELCDLLLAFQETKIYHIDIRCTKQVSG